MDKLGKMQVTFKFQARQRDFHSYLLTEEILEKHFNCSGTIGVRNLIILCSGNNDGYFYRDLHISFSLFGLKRDYVQTAAIDVIRLLKDIAADLDKGAEPSSSRFGNCLGLNARVEIVFKSSEPLPNENKDHRIMRKVTFSLEGQKAWQSWVQTRFCKIGSIKFHTDDQTNFAGYILGDLTNLELIPPPRFTPGFMPWYFRSIEGEVPFEDCVLDMAIRMISSGPNDELYDFIAIHFDHQLGV